MQNKYGLISWGSMDRISVNILWGCELGTKKIGRLNGGPMDLKPYKNMEPVRTNKLGET